MEVRLTTLCENTAAFGFWAEWGLSILIEVNGSKVLMDTGMSTTALHNAQLLGLSFSNLNAIVLSHGHMDHTGGLKEVLRIAGPTSVVGHPDLWNPKYARLKSGKQIYIGVPFLREEMESLGASFNLSSDPVEITPHIVTSGEVPITTDYEQIAKESLLRTGSGLEPDSFTDDLSLAIKTDNGLIVVLGCAHRGPVNSIRRLQKVTGEERIYAVVGGTHLKDASKERIEKTISAFKKMNVSKVGCAHCTGFKAASMMSEAFGDDFVNLNAGVQLVFP